MDETQQLLYKFRNLTISENEKLKLKQKADHFYFNTEKEILTDNEYDILAEQLQSTNVGCSPLISKTDLPLWMGSLDKVYNDKELNLWIKKVTSDKYIIQCKLDGVSCLIINKDNKLKAYTRGNGKVGTDISHLIRYFIKDERLPDNIALRCEIIIKKETFNQKYKHAFSNPRSFVSGVVNRKQENIVISELNDLCLIAYELINFPVHEYQKNILTQIEIIEQLNCIQFVNFKTISREAASEFLTQKSLSNLFKEMKNNSLFEMDGLVILANTPYIRVTEGNPKHSIAFKVRGDNVKEAKVTFIEWNVGKTGVFTPKVHIVPTEINGTTVSCFTGFNANYLMEKGIGEGAIILVTRAGDAIPQIIGVKQTGVLTFPKDYEWKGDCRIVEKIESKERIIKQILHFVESVDIPYIKEATINKLYNNGCTSIELFLKLTQKDLLLFGPKLSSTIYNSIQKSFEAPIEKFLSGYNAFGDYIGEKKILLLLQKYPNLFELENLDAIDLVSIEGIGSKTATQIKQHFINAKLIYKNIIQNKLFKGVLHTPTSKQNTVELFKVCVSGTRDPLFIQELKNRGFVLSDNITKKLKY